MSIDKFGLGDWWPRPEQAAAGGLDHLPADQWPMLAARWLAAGFDSPLLRQLAGLRSGQQVVGRSGEHGVVAWPASGGQSNPSAPWTSDGRAAARAALELMPEAMRSIGFDPAPADEEFVARCQSALDVVRHDLDVTGCGRYRMRASFSAGWPRTVYATLPDGSYWGEGEGMSRGMGSSWLLFSAADSVSATIKEVHEIEWPVCAVHSGHPATSVWDGEEPAHFIDKVVWWRCTNTGHARAGRSAHRRDRQDTVSDGAASSP
jgi:hypothetical protein